jgi:hypothetical protein
MPLATANGRDHSSPRQVTAAMAATKSYQKKNTQGVPLKKGLQPKPPPSPVSFYPRMLFSHFLRCPRRRW